MSLLKLIASLAGLMVLVSCATVGKFEKRMSANIGLTKTQLIDVMGIPDREYASHNIEIIEYNQSRTGITSSTDSTVVNGYLINTTSKVPYTTSCKLEFKLINGKVTNYRYAGDMCRSR